MEYNGVRKVFEITISKEELKQLIEKYFLEKTNKKVTFSTRTTTEREGAYCRESEYAKTRYFLEQEVEIVGLIKQATLELTEEEIKQMLKEIFKEYDVTYISFKSKFEHKYQYEFKEPIFEGVHIYYAEKEKEKGDNDEDWSLRRKF